MTFNCSSKIIFNFLVWNFKRKVVYLKLTADIYILPVLSNCFLMQMEWYSYLNSLYFSRNSSRSIFPFLKLASMLLLSSSTSFAFSVSILMRFSVEYFLLTASFFAWSSFTFFTNSSFCACFFATSSSVVRMVSNKASFSLISSSRILFAWESI